MSSAHPLLQPEVVRTVERAGSDRLGRPWTSTGFTNLNERASHPCGVFRGEPFSVFAKLDHTATGAEQFRCELRGLELLGRLSEVRTTGPVGAGVVDSAAGTLLLLDAIDELPAERRTTEDWRGVGRALATLHQVHADRFGLDLGPDSFDGFFGPLRQDNRPVESNRWVDFYAERRVLPWLRSAVDSGCLPMASASGVERLVERFPVLLGSEPRPTLVHGDAQQNNLLTTANDVVLVDPAPYFGHPELDLALVDYFAPVPDAVFDGYRDVTPIDPGFEERRELCRLFGYLAVLTVDGRSPFGRPFVERVAKVVETYG